MELNDSDLQLVEALKLQIINNYRILKSMILDFLEDIF